MKPLAVPSAPTSEVTPSADAALRRGVLLLGATVWGSSLLFGLFVLSFYGGPLLTGDLGRWNEILPGLYDSRTEAATLGIGLHFVGGGILLVLGCVQLIPYVRSRYPALHRWLGRVYVSAAILTSIGGLAFILGKGTIGGRVMDVGFGGYGALTLLAAAQTIRHAVGRRFDEHRAWGIRLFALAVGSWLYRMDYGFWLLLTDGLGHDDTFTGPFDRFMAFAFYLPNLLVAELYIGGRARLRSPRAKWLAAAGLFSATAFVVLATWFFTLHYWGPAIVELLGGWTVAGG